MWPEEKIRFVAASQVNQYSITKGQIQSMQNLNTNAI